MTEPLYHPLNIGSRTEQAVTLITELITSGRLASGDFLPSEPELSRQLGISRATVRQALRTLEARGLVVTKHGIGVQVTDRTREVATDSIGRMLLRRGSGPRDALEVRRMLESQAASLAAERATEDDIRAIGEAIAAMRSQTLSVEEYVERDLAFHLRIAEASKNEVLVALVHALRGLLLDTIAATYALYRLPGRRHEQHSAVLAAIKTHDSAAAEAAMRAHLSGLEAAVNARSAAEPERPQPATAVSRVAEGNGRRLSRAQSTKS